MADTTISDRDVLAFADFDNRYLNTGIERKALDKLPIIDMTPFTDDSGSTAARQKVAKDIRDACVNIGFFFLAGHGIPKSEFDELEDYGFRFFALPLDAKMTVHAGKSSQGQGFLQVGGVNPDANTDKAADLKERFIMSRELEPGEPQEGRYSAGASQWPAPDVLPGFEDFMKAHMKRRMAVARRLLHALAMSLELAPDYFDASHRHMGCAQILNYYPPFDGGPKPTQWSFSPHTAYGTLTLLSQDDIGGLQVRNMDGDWIDVPPVAGAFVVNIGDLLARWTNDLYTSNLHRVFNLSDRPRISVPFFLYPHGMAEVRCIETCQGPGNPPRYEPVLAGAYMNELITRSSQSGRPGVSKQTASRMKAN